MLSKVSGRLNHTILGIKYGVTLQVQDILLVWLIGGPESSPKRLILKHV